MFFRRVLQMPPEAPIGPQKSFSPRFHYIDDQPLEITSQLKGYNLTRSCGGGGGNVTYKGDIIEGDGKGSGAWFRGKMRWAPLPVLLLLVLTAIALFSLIGHQMELKEVVESRTPPSLLDLEPHPSISRLPGSLEEYKKNWSRSEGNIGVTSNKVEEEFENKENNKGREIIKGEEEEQNEEGGMDEEDDLMYSDEGEGDRGRTFMERILSSFQAAAASSPPLQNLNFNQRRMVPNAHKYGDFQGMSKYMNFRTTPVAVSPTLPSFPFRSPVSTTITPPKNKSESWECRSPEVGLCRGIVPWDLTSKPGIRLPSHTPAYLELLLASSCSSRAAHFLCSLLEPQCQPDSAPPLPPCRSICRAVAEECSGFIFGSQELAEVFKCDNYPDSRNPAECVNLAAGGGECLKGESRCRDGSCIPRRWLCDGTADCSQGEDEEGCPSLNCPSRYQFPCSSGVGCVSRERRCDGRPDCPDASDEIGCRRVQYERMTGYRGRGSSHSSPCPLGELRCLDGVCILPSQICDGTPDCSDAADEINC